MDFQLNSKLISDFETYLSDLQKERKDRPNTVQFHGQMLPEWAVYEISAMHSQVNQERRKLGKDPLPLSEIIRAEHTAVGHSDYTHKFALYCAQLVQDNF